MAEVLATAAAGPVIEMTVQKAKSTARRAVRYGLKLAELATVPYTTAYIWPTYIFNILNTPNVLLENVIQTAFPGDDPLSAIAKTGMRFMPGLIFQAITLVSYWSSFGALLFAYDRIWKQIDKRLGDKKKGVVGKAQGYQQATHVYHHHITEEKPVAKKPLPEEKPLQEIVQEPAEKPKKDDKNSRFSVVENNVEPTD